MARNRGEATHVGRDAPMRDGLSFHPTREPKFEEILDDPVVQAVMAADGVDRDDRTCRLGAVDASVRGDRNHRLDDRSVLLVPKGEPEARAIGVSV